jgi:hypothetical protein
MLRSGLTALLLAVPYVNATALTAMLGANEKSCYYADVDGVGEKVGEWSPNPSADVGFYFAVQSGGSFDIDYTVMDPDDRVILTGKDERQGDYIFTANKVRRY